MKFDFNLALKIYATIQDIKSLKSGEIGDVVNVAPIITKIDGKKVKIEIKVTEI